MKIVGFKKCDFVAGDGTQVNGMNVFLEEPISNNGKGFETEKFYLSDAKQKKMGVNIDGLVGKDVRLMYNRYGKVEDIRVIEK